MEFYSQIIAHMYIEFDLTAHHFFNTNIIYVCLKLPYSQTTATATATAACRNETRRLCACVPGMLAHYYYFRYEGSFEG